MDTLLYVIDKLPMLVKVLFLLSAIVSSAVLILAIRMDASYPDDVVVE